MSDDGANEGPKDEYLHNYLASKVEAKKIYFSPRFEEITSKYWQLLRGDKTADLSNITVSKEQYVCLLKRMYKVLLPLYREAEMSKEIDQEWLQDSGGMPALNLHLFTKVLFRIAHQWAVHIDLDEYIEILTRVYGRITVRKVIKAVDGSSILCYPTIYTEIIPEEENAEAFAPNTSGADEALLEPCASDEEDKDGWDYKFVEDPGSMTLKKHKKRAAPPPPAPTGGDGLDMDSAPLFSVKDDIVFKEEVIFHQNSGDYKPKQDDMVSYVLADLSDVVPVGYPTEQFLTWMRNDVHTKLEEAKQGRKEALARMKREVMETGGAGREPQLKKEEDGGLVNAHGAYIELPYLLVSNAPVCKVRAKAKLVDTLYNALRAVIKDTHSLHLRMHMDHPKPSLRSGATKSRAPVGGTEPTTEINKFGYNPALRRRIRYKEVPLFSKSPKAVHVNINYMYEHPDFVSAYRCDVERVENSNKLAIKPNDEYQRDEDFLAVDTPYKKMRQIMLVKKFETLYTENLNADENDLKRIDKIVEREEGRRKQVRTAEPLNTKGLGETFEEKSLIKMMKGPFYQHASAAGIKEDDFVTCAQQDLIDYATTPAQRVLLIGKPRSGKTMLAKKLNTKLDLVHVSVENWLTALMEKHKKFWEEPPEPEEAPEGFEGEWVPPPIIWGTELEMAVYASMKAGGGPTHEQNVQILKMFMNSPEAQTKGYVLDLNFYRTPESWAKIIRSEQLLGPPDASTRMPEFTHVIELECEDAEVKLRAKHMRLDIEDVKEDGEKALGNGQVYSRWEIADRNKVIPPKLDEEGEPIVEEEDPDAPKKLDTGSMVQRVQDTDTFIGEELAHYNANERPALDDMLVRLFNHQYLKLDSAGLIPDELADAAAWRLREDDSIPLRPIARGWPEGGPSDFKSCLTEPLEEPKEGEPEPLPRQWSLWRQTDPVALFNGQVIPGEPDKAVSYADSMFVFATEENMKAFQLEPKKYLQAAPQMPSSYRLMIVGPKGSGCHTQANKLQDQYGWRVVDYAQLVRQRIETILAEEVHLPNNIVPGKSKIGLSQAEIDEIKTGKPFPSWKFIPWVLDHLGYPLAEKPDPPEPVEEKVDPDTLGEEERAAWEKAEKAAAAKKAKAEAEAAKIAKEKEEYKARRAAAVAAGEDLEALGLLATGEDEPITEDLSIDKLVLKPDADGKTPFVGGFILLGFPQTETHANKLKEHGIGFDRILFLTDPSEEDAGKELKARMSAQSIHYDYDAELEKANKIIGVAREFLKQTSGEEGDEGVDITREINATGSIDEVAVRIRFEIDPFSDRCDNPDDVRDPVDPADEEAKRLPIGDFGDYCPVTYVKEGFLLKGSVEQEVQVFGKTYRLAGENEMNEFKANPTKFLSAAQVLPLAPPAPKIMIMGMKGSGVTTQIQKLCSKYKLDELNLKDEFMAKMKSEKETRQRRRLLERGFRPPLPADEETGEVPPDPEIQDDPEDFEKEAHERELMRLICNKDKGLIIDGTWTGFPEEAVTAVDPAGYAGLLYESRRAPELVVILRCEEATAFDRMIDAEATKAKYEELMKTLNDNMAKAKEEERVAKLEEVTKEMTEANEGAGEEEKKSAEEVQKEIDEAMEAWNAEKDEADAAALEGMEYPEKPDLEEMMKEHKEKITAQQEADKEFFGDADGGLINELAQKGIPVIDDIPADTSADFVFLKLVDRLKAHFQMRPDLIERAQAQALAPKDLPLYEQKSYIYQPSKFGPFCPIAQSNPVKSRDHAVLYRERIYYLGDADAQAMFLQEPSKYTKGVEPVPLDVQMIPRVSVLGLPKSGKSELCSRISALTGAVHLQMDQILEKFIDADSAQCERLRASMKSEGRGIDDQLMVTLLSKRLKCKDCLANGYVLEDFPKTRGQAAAMARAGVNPANVFHIRISHEEVYKRTDAKKDTDFEANRTILAKRLRYLEANIAHVTGFYQRIYNSLIEIDGFKSKWFMEDRALTAIEANLLSRQLFARAYCFRGDDGFPERPCELKDLHCDRALMKASLSQFAYHCPVTWKNTKELVKCTHDPENCILYQNVFYYFCGQSEKEMFMNNPARFVNNVIFSSAKGIPLRLKPHKAAEIVAQEKGILGHCPVALIDSGRVVKGDLLLCSQYKETKFCFENEQNLQKFLKTPAKYNGAELPTKMPPHQDPVSLHSLQQNEESTTFMEQALGSVVTRGLREVAENRLKYPNLSVKETMLKLFAIFLKAENTANTPYMKDKYRAKMRDFVERCELAEELSDLSEEKASKQKQGKWPEFKEKYYNDLGAKYDEVLKQSIQEKKQGFSSYLK